MLTANHVPPAGPIGLEGLVIYNRRVFQSSTTCIGCFFSITYHGINIAILFALYCLLAVCKTIQSHYFLFVRQEWG